MRFAVAATLPSIRFNLAGRSPMLDRAGDARRSAQSRRSGREERRMRCLRGRWFAAAALALLASAVVTATIPDYGITWDERLYLEAGIRYAEWLANPTIASIDDHWRFAHPPFRKLLGGLTHRLFHEQLALLSPLDAYRLATVPFVFLLTFVLFGFAHQLFGTAVAWAVTATWCLLPRSFFHAHLGAFDYTITALGFAACVAYWQSFERRRWLAVAGVALGLGVATRLDAGIAVLPMLVLLAARLVAAPPAGRGTLRTLADQAPMALLPPLVLLASWPWLWREPLQRLSTLFLSQLRHFPVPSFYFGRIYSEPPFHFPFALLALTLPVVTLLAVGAGLLRLRRRDQRATLEFLLAGAIGPLLVIALPGVPKTDGTRHFLLAVPFVCLVAGAGLCELRDRLRRPALRRALVPAYLLLLVATTLPAILRLHPYEIAYFNGLVGGTSGAQRRGFDLDYWGSSYRAALPWINDHPEYTYWVPLAPRLLGYYRESGELAPEVRLGGPDDSDAVVVINRPSFLNPELWQCLQRRDPLFAAGPPDVDLVRICERRKPATP
jgi:4-amino-4-deoxy-L-arabinose transferase-like glycosyltransferase